MPYPVLKMLISGEWTDGSSGKSEPVICPADGSQIGTLPHASPADLDAALPFLINAGIQNAGQTCSAQPCRRPATCFCIAPMGTACGPGLAAAAARTDPDTTALASTGATTWR